MEIIILEIKKDVCGIFLVIVDLKSKGESINEKMKKYFKIGNSNSDSFDENNCLGIKGVFGFFSFDVGFKRVSSKVG